jgi:segregation and condensation protein A
MAEERSTQLTISLPRYEGPFDLLLSLIRRNEWSIDDLPVREITAQFLAYIKAAQNLDQELAGEFVETASWLVLLKSRSMLPVEGIEGPTPREELRRAVLDHTTLLAKSKFLRERYEGNLHPGSSGAPAGRQNSVIPASIDDHPTVEDVLEAVRRALEAARAAASLQTTDSESATVEEQLRWITSRLASFPVKTAISTQEWFAVQPTTTAQVALLLALLELASKGCVLLHQAADFGAIRVKALREIPVDPDEHSLATVG